MEQPACKTCGSKVTRFVKSKNQWWEWCSNKCMSLDPAVVAKKAATNQQRFGGHPMSNRECRLKLKETVIKNYGVDNPSKADAVKAKMKETFIKNYGVDNPSKHPVIIGKIKEKADTRNYVQVLEKRKVTNLAALGVESNKQSHLAPDAIEKLHNVDWLRTEHIDRKKSCEQIAKELGCSPTPILTRLAAAGIQVRRYGISQVEQEIQQYVREFDSSCEVNNRTIISPSELDIVSHARKFAIEVDGVYWHSELQGKHNRYHLLKTEQAAAAGIELWHVFDTEWQNKQEIVKSKISGKFGQHTRIHARQCQVRNVTKKEKSQFLNENHLQGTAGSAVNLGLYFKDELVALATFGKARFNKTVTWELVRFCNKLYTCVQGGASKLLAAFVSQENPTSIISYADRRWSTGKLYETLGFTFSHNSGPNYWYFLDGRSLESRMKYQKHKLAALFGDVDLSKTEWEIMQTHGYNRVWDCGNIVYVWRKDES